MIGLFEFLGLFTIALCIYDLCGIEFLVARSPFRYLCRFQRPHGILIRSSCESRMYQTRRMLIPGTPAWLVIYDLSRPCFLPSGRSAPLQPPSAAVPSSWS